MNEMSQTNIKLEGGKLDGRYYTMDQKNDIMQSLFCCFCEAPNEYSISESDPNFNVSSKKGTIKEDSDCLVRLFCVCNRPFESKMKLFKEEVAIIERPCRCCLEYMPCNENEIIVRNKNGRTLGTLRVPCNCIAGNFFSCADAQIEVYSGENQSLIYTIEGTRCQKSIFFPFCRCCYCPNVDYCIFDNLNLKVGKIFNIYNGFCTQLFSRTDKFGIEFPLKADEEHKILLLSAVMFLDYLRYETPIFCTGCR